MNKCALYIPRPGWTSKAVQYGYVDALRSLGWRVYVGDPKTKLCCRQWIEKHNIQLIMTSSRYGIRQLPIQIINDNYVAVIINALPLNSTNKTIDGPYEFAHEDELDIIKEIKNVLLYTPLEQNVWSEYMDGWIDSHEIGLFHLPYAGNILRAMPPTCSLLADVAMVANFNHRQDIMKRLIEPLFKRVDLLGYSYQAFGDNIWRLAGLNYNGPLSGDFSKLAHVYATAKVCPNVHTEKQVVSHAYINERSFMIPLCGGVQVSDNPIAVQYLGLNCEIAVNITDFINKVISLIEDQSNRSDIIKASVAHVANNHTYFNRLVDIFYAIALPDLAEEAEAHGSRMAIRHCWEIDARLSAEERGMQYE